MKRILLLLLVCSQSLLVFAQKNTPKWMDKARKAVFTITTYGKDGNKLTTGNGFFISENGDAVSAYELFKGAEKATIQDADGNQYPVKAILGADELYDVIKFQVAVPRKVNALPIAKEPAAEGAVIYMLPFSTGKTAVFKNGAIEEVSNLKDDFKYYKVSVPMESSEENVPLLTADGAVLALTQPDAGGNTAHSFGLSAGYANQLQINTTDLLSSTYRNIGIRKGWPKDPEQATVALFLTTNAQTPQQQLETLNDFIAAFPNLADGYLNRANLYAYSRTALSDNPAQQADYLNKALEDIRTAGKQANQPSEVLYNQAKLIFGVSASDSTLQQKGWTIQDAIETLDKAIAASDLPLYHQLKGDIYVSQDNYPAAFDEYMIVNASDLATPSTFYLAAKVKENITGFNIGDVIQLLTQAIDACNETQTDEASIYLLERIDWRLRLMQFDEAIADYDQYYNMVDGEVYPNFYYLREQAKFRAGDLDGALADIQEAIKGSATADYYAEEAAVYIRKQAYAEALNSLNKAIELAPDFAACYRLRGVCYLRTDQKAEACESLQKADELGDPVAAKLLKENC